jgi:FkbM family methyltransferase
MASPLFALRRRRWFQRLTAALDRQVSVRAAGLPFPLTMRLGPNLSLVAGKLGERAERQAFGRLLATEPPRSFWDIGANVGLYGFTFAARLPGRPCVMVEPDPRNAACLRRTIERARLQNVTVIEAAAAEREGEAEFATDPLTGATGQLVHAGPSFIERHHGVAPPKRTVRTVTLDSLLAHHPAPDLIKIDVEQAELQVLRGATELLRRQPTVLIELSGEREAGRLLQRAGYRLTDWRTGQPAPDGAWSTVAYPPRYALSP